MSGQRERCGPDPDKIESGGKGRVGGGPGRGCPLQSGGRPRSWPNSAPSAAVGGVAPGGVHGRLGRYHQGSGRAAGGLQVQFAPALLGAVAAASWRRWRRWRDRCPLMLEGPFAEAEDLEQATGTPRWPADPDSGRPRSFWARGTVTSPALAQIAAGPLGPASAEASFFGQKRQRQSWIEPVGRNPHPPGWLSRGSAPSAQQVRAGFPPLAALLPGRAVGGVEAGQDRRVVEVGPDPFLELQEDLGPGGVLGAVRTSAGRPGRARSGCRRR